MWRYIGENVNSIRCGTILKVIWTSLRPQYVWMLVKDDLFIFALRSQVQ